jgi:Flp pilus assembly protein TadG
MIFANSGKRRLRRAMLRQLLTFSRKKDGVVSIEAALLFPFMILLLLGMIDVTVILSAQRKATVATSAVVDLATQASAAVSKTQLNQYIDAVDAILKPYNAQDMKIELFNYRPNGNNVNLDWQPCPRQLRWHAVEHDNGRTQEAHRRRKRHPRSAGYASTSSRSSAMCSVLVRSRSKTSWPSARARDARSTAPTADTARHSHRHQYQRPQRCKSTPGPLHFQPWSSGGNLSKHGSSLSPASRVRAVAASGLQHDPLMRQRHQAQTSRGQAVAAFLLTCHHWHRGGLPDLVAECTGVRLCVLPTGCTERDGA